MYIVRLMHIAEDKSAEYRETLWWFFSHSQNVNWGKRVLLVHTHVDEALGSVPWTQPGQSLLTTALKPLLFHMLHPFYFLANCANEETLHGNIFSVEKRNRTDISTREENFSNRVLMQDLNKLYGMCGIPKAKDGLKGTIWVPLMPYQL